MNNAVLGKTMENARNDRDIKLLSTGATGNYLVSEPNYHTYTPPLPPPPPPRKFVRHRNERNILMNKPVYLHLSIFKKSKIVM